MDDNTPEWVKEIEDRYESTPKVGPFAQKVFNTDVDKLLSALKTAMEALDKGCSCFPEKKGDVIKQFPHLSVKGCGNCEAIEKIRKGEFE